MILAALEKYFIKNYINGKKNVFSFRARFSAFENNKSLLSREKMRHNSMSNIVVCL
jgi:hypothetical protein